MGGTDTYFTMKDGTISDNTSTGYGGGGVYVNGGTFTMEKGMISGNKATGNNNNGGGVYVDGYTFNMNGGTISGNEAIKDGGGVYVTGTSGTFAMSGNSKISENKTTGNEGNGGGVYVDTFCQFTMSGDSEISGNTTQKQGGGVFVADMCAFTMSGNSKISENKANGDNSNGGGVSNSGSGTFEMNGGKIQGNEAAYYAGVRVDGGSFTMKAGEISGNKANQSIGGVYVYSATFTMSGGKIVDNTASETCGGVRVLSSTFNLSGEVDISSNKAGNADKNVVLSDGQIITIQGELKNANPIGVSFSSALTGDTVFTSDYGSKMSNADPAKYFKSEQDGYGVFKNETSNEAMLAKIAIETGFKDETIDIEGVKYTGKEIKP